MTYRKVIRRVSEVKEHENTHVVITWLVKKIRVFKKIIHRLSPEATCQMNACGSSINREWPRVIKYFSSQFVVTEFHWKNRYLFINKHPQSKFNDIKITELISL